MELFKPRNNESLDEYIYRLGNNKKDSGISWNEVSDGIHTFFDKKISKDAIRHMFYGMKQRDNIEEIGVGNRILVVSDQHFPYNLPVSVLSEYANKVDVLIFNGDEEDSQGISKFQKKYRVPFVDEMIGTRQMIIDTINLIKPKKVKLNYGNHNVRLISYFSEKIHEDLLELMPQTNLDFIVELGFYKHNHKEGSKTYYEPLTKVFENSGIDIEYTKCWWNRIGKTIFTHPKAFKSGILSTTEKAYLYFVQIGQTDVDCIVMAHTHASGIARYGNVYLIESGCLCQSLSYAGDGRLSKPQSQGFVYVVQDKDGNFNYNKSKLNFI